MEILADVSHKWVCLAFATLHMLNELKVVILHWKRTIITFLSFLTGVLEKPINMTFKSIGSSKFDGENRV